MHKSHLKHMGKHVFTMKQTHVRHVFTMKQTHVRHVFGDSCILAGKPVP
jgi:hypothetical protein